MTRDVGIGNLRSLTFTHRIGLAARGDARAPQGAKSTEIDIHHKTQNAACIAYP